MNAENHILRLSDAPVARRTDRIHPDVTDTHILSFADTYRNKLIKKGPPQWVSDCPPLATVPSHENETSVPMKYSRSHFQALREVGLFRFKTKSLPSITSDTDAMRSVKGMPIDELFQQLKEGRDFWCEQPQLYGAIADEIWQQIQNADVSVSPPSHFQLACTDTNDDDMTEAAAALEVTNYLPEAEAS